MRAALFLTAVNLLVASMASANVCPAFVMGKYACRDQATGKVAYMVLEKGQVDEQPAISAKFGDQQAQALPCFTGSNNVELCNQEQRSADAEIAKMCNAQLGQKVAVISHKGFSDANTLSADISISQKPMAGGALTKIADTQLKLTKAGANINLFMVLVSAADSFRVNATCTKN